jgi:hypothetical protein
MAYTSQVTPEQWVASIGSANAVANIIASMRSN